MHNSSQPASLFTTIARFKSDGLSGAVRLLRTSKSKNFIIISVVNYRNLIFLLTASYTLANINRSKYGKPAKNLQRRSFIYIIVMCANIEHYMEMHRVLFMDTLFGYENTMNIIEREERRFSRIVAVIQNFRCVCLANSRAT